MTRDLFTEQDERRISAAIMTAEKATSGEVLAIVCYRSDSYLHVPFLVAALAALVVPWPLIYLTWIKVQWIYVAQLLVFAGLLLATWPVPVRMAFVPASLKRANAHRRAVEQFLAQNLHTTKGRTGVMIFVALAERHAEILADHGIDDKVEQNVWQGIVDKLTADLSEDRAADGFVRAIEACGQLLARHFPPGSLDENELPNRLIVLA